MGREKQKTLIILFVILVSVFFSFSSLNVQADSRNIFKIATVLDQPNNISISDTKNGGQLKLTWTNPTSTFSKIRIYRSTRLGDKGTSVAETPEETFYDNGLYNNQSYFYTLKTIDSVGNESSNTDQYEGRPTAPFNAPTGISVVDPGTGSSLIIQWSPLASGSYVKIYRADSNNMTSNLIAEQLTSGRYVDQNLTPGLAYYYELSASDYYGNESSLSPRYLGKPQFSETRDVIPPSPPTAIKVQDMGLKDSLLINWTNPKENDFSFVRIYRSTWKSELGNLIADNIKSATYTDRPVDWDQDYYYTIHSVDNMGNESANKDQYRGRAVYETTSAVYDVKIQDQGNGKVILTWTNPTSLFDYLRIYRSLEQDDIGVLVQDKVKTASFTDASIEVGQTYYYTLRTVNKFGIESDDNTQYQIISYLNGPSNVEVIDVGSGGALSLKWKNPSSTKFDGVRIYRSLKLFNADNKGEVIAAKAGGDSYLDNGLAVGKTYYYQLKSLDKSGNESSNTDQYYGTPTLKQFQKIAGLDSDGDGLTDKEEKKYRTNANKSDTDADGLNDYEEVIIFHTNPLRKDTDGDGYLDKEEMANGYSPFETPPGTYAYGHKWVKDLSVEQEKATNMVNTLKATFGASKVKKISSAKINQYIKAFVYGGYSMADIIADIKKPGKISNTIDSKNFKK